MAVFIARWESGGCGRTAGLPPPPPYPPTPTPPPERGPACRTLRFARPCLPYTIRRYKWIFVTVTGKSICCDRASSQTGLDEASLKTRLGCSGSFSKSSQAELGGGAKASARLGCSGPRSCGDLAGRAAVCRGHFVEQG